MEIRNLKECLMSEEENVSVIDQQYTDQQEVASPSEPEMEHDEPIEIKQQPPKRKDAEYNFAQLRRENEALRQAKLEYENELLRLKNHQYQQYDDEEVDQEEDRDELSDDDLVTGKQTKKLIKKVLAKQTQAEVQKFIKKYAHQKEVDELEERIKVSMPDFKEVVSDDAIEYIKTMHPEIADSLGALKDQPYKQAKAIYQAAKAFVPRQSIQTKIEKIKAQENSKKPLSVQAAPKQSALGQAHLFENGLTPELKAQLWKEMQDAKKHF